MLKKSLLGITLLTLMSHAKVELKVINFPKKEVRIEWNNEAINPSNKDWIALYKRGDSVAWGNVVSWKWVKDLDCSNPDPEGCHDAYHMDGLKKGLYDVRYFKNNTFKITTSIPLNNDIQNNINLTRLNAIYSSKKHTIDMNIPTNGHYLNPNPKDWVGVYKVGDSNKWSNVKAWGWAKNFDKGQKDDKSSSYSIHNVNLPAGKYEVRYFLNNTFNTYKKSNTFTGVPQNKH